MCLLDRSPKKEAHSAEIVKSRVAATVFVSHSLLMGESKNARNGYVVFVGDAYLDVIAHRLQKALKPRYWLRRQMVSPARSDKKLVKLLEMFFRNSFFVFEIFSLCSANLSLNAILVKVAEQLGEGGSKIEGLKIVGKTLGEPGAAIGLTESWSDLDVLHAATNFAIHMHEQVIEVALLGHQWLTMIGEWQGHKPSSREPAADLAENNCITQGRAWSR
jgi:hypothetical protein